MNDKDAMSQMMDWAETLLLRSWIQGVLLDEYAPADWREMVTNQEILSGPPLRARLASVRAGILESPVETAQFQDWQDAAEKLIRSVEDDQNLEEQQ